VGWVVSSGEGFWIGATIVGIILFSIGFTQPRMSLFVLLFSMLLSPEFGARDVQGAGFTIRLEDVLLVIMSFAWLAKWAVYKQLGMTVKTTLTRPILAYIAVCILATILGILSGSVKSGPRGFFFILKYFEYFVIFFLVINNVHSREQIKQLLIAMLVTYIFVLVLGFMQIPSGHRISAPFEGPSGEPNTLGGYLLILFSLTTMFFLNSTRFLHKVTFGSLAVFGFLAMLFTLSRSTWVGLAGMYFFLLKYSSKKGTLLFVGVMGILVFPFIVPETVIDRFQYTYMGDYKNVGNQELHEGVASNEIVLDTSTQARFFEMRRSFNDFIKKPVFGYGVTGYHFLDAQYHKVLIETGLVGLFAFIFLINRLWKSLVETWRKYGQDPLYNSLTVGSICALVALLFQSIGTNSFIIVRIMEPFWALVGLTLAIPIIEEKQPVEEEPETPKEPVEENDPDLSFHLEK
jgi:hypothetical protein